MSKIRLNKKTIEMLITGLTIIQMQLQDDRRDHNGNVLKHDDIDELQRSIIILEDIKMDLYD